MTPSDEWLCGAYGDIAATIARDQDVHCFTSPRGERGCPTLAACEANMDVARGRVFRLIQEGAAAGDPVAAYLAEEITRPGQVHGGEE
jgi:hypothetical protein